jgi:hypothetical protein
VSAAARRLASTSTSFIYRDALDWLRDFGRAPILRNGERVLIYADPPYLPSTLKSPQRYRCKFDELQHKELLALLIQASERGALVMLSGYLSELYSNTLNGWRRVDFDVITRGHSWATESVWMNFPAWLPLHDYRHLGADFRERERIKRKRARWRARFAKLPAAERAAMMEVLRDLAAPDLTVGAGAARDPLAISSEGGLLELASPLPAALERAPGAGLDHPGGRL